ncbi:uncharacterized protein C6orf132 homolog [Mantella aurantiaca]
MKKNSSMQGTLNKLFGKKNSSTNSLYAENPPWMKPQGVKKASVDYHAEVHNSFSFLDDSGTATLKARPGPRARPVLQFSTSNTDTQGLAVPTPSVPSGYSDNSSIGNGSKLNGNYRLYSSVGDLHLTNYYQYLDEEIPAPPSMPPPPPPSMPPPPPPSMINAPPSQESPPSSTISSPTSPSVPDFIPPTPNSSAITRPNFEPSTDTSTVPTVSEQRQTDNIAKWKSEGSKDVPMTLPNRFSLNTAGFQHSHGQTTNSVDPHSSLPKTFKVPPPAPMRTSSMQLQELQNISYSTEPPQSPVPSSFNPSVQAKLFSASNQGKTNLNDTLNKRKSMIIMEDLKDQSQKNHTVERNFTNTDSTTSGSLSLKSSMNTKTPFELDIERKTGDNRQGSESGINDHQKQYSMKTNETEFPSVISEKIKGGPKRPLSSIEFNKISFNNDGYLPNGHKSTKDAVKVISVKPILTDLSLSNTNVQPPQNSLTGKSMHAKEVAEMYNDIKIDQRAAAQIRQEAPPTPPPMPPPPPPIMTPPKPPAMPPPPPPVTITPQKTSPIHNFVAPPPASPIVASMPPVPQASPLLPPKPKTISAFSTSSVILPPPAPPKAPPAPPPLPCQTGTSTSEPQLPLLKALQEKQQTLKQISKKPIEIRSAQKSSIDLTEDDEQKARVGKIKGELEALFSPKKDEKLRDLKNSHPSLEANKKSPNGITTQKKGGENTLVNSLMMKVPLIPSVFDKEDVDGDTSDWIPKSSNTNFQIPEADYSPITPTQTMEKPAYADVQSDNAKPLLEISSKKQASPLKFTDVVSKKSNDIPAYKPHYERKAAGNLALDKFPLAVSEKVQSLKKDEEIPYAATSLKIDSPINKEVGISKHPVTSEPIETISPMALLLAAKNRAQRGSRSMPLEGSNLPKISVSGRTVASPLNSQYIDAKTLTSQYNDAKTNTFVVVPKKEIGGQFSEEEVTSFSSKPNSHLSNAASSKWTDGEFPSSTINISGLYPRKSDDEKPSLMNVEDRNENFRNVTEHHNSNNISNFIDSYTFNISSVPSPVPASKTHENIDYGIIPPPEEFMNTPPSRDIERHQNDRFYVNSKTRSDLGSNYDWNKESNLPSLSQTSFYNSDFNKHTIDNYSTGIGTDPHKGSLIKKRLYMPDPESSGSYGKNTHSLRSSALPVSYSHMHSQSSSSMIPESRRSSNPSRYMSQGRRVSSENMVPAMTDMKYKPQNSEYGKSMSRPQSTYQPGMTFTVRPGTRQPISHMYQGGYL